MNAANRIKRRSWNGEHWDEERSGLRSAGEILAWIAQLHRTYLLHLVRVVRVVLGTESRRQFSRTAAAERVLFVVIVVGVLLEPLFAANEPLATVHDVRLIQPERGERCWCA